jgi:hypothetical protein
MTSAAFTKKIEAAFFLDETVIPKGTKYFDSKTCLNVIEVDRNRSLRIYRSDASKLKVGFSRAAKMSPIAFAIAVSVMVGPNRNTFFSKGRAK